MNTNEENNLNNPISIYDGNNSNVLNNTTSDDITPDDITDTQKSQFIYLLSIKDINKDDRNDFDSFIKEIIENNTEAILTGDTNIVEYYITKYLNIPREEMNTLTTANFKINSEFNMLNEIGYYLPCLKSLILNYSSINSIGSIGTSFLNLEILHVSNCSIEDLTGILIY